MDGDFSLDALRAAIVGRFPELASSRFTLLTAGWDNVAVDVDDHLIFRFPRDAEAAQAITREASLLRAVRSAVFMPVPELELIEEPRVFSRHEKIPGEHLVRAQYEQLSHGARQKLAAEMALFYAELHLLDPAAMLAAGAGPETPWPSPEEILGPALEHLPRAAHDFAKRTVTEWAALPPDPLGSVCCFLDAHGWNMAFDHARNRLNGVYDFADTVIAPAHEEFIYTSFISPDLTERICVEYEWLTGRKLDRRRIHLVTGVLRLCELGFGLPPDKLETTVQFALDWAAHDAEMKV